MEHIYPQKATEKCWKNEFAGLRQKQRNALRNSIGNLVPLSRPKNSALSNKCFDEKKGSSGSTVGYLYGCYSENEVALNDNWGAEEILQRSLKLLEFLEKRWALEFGSVQDKVAFLGLEFVEGAHQQSIVLEEPESPGDEDEPIT